MRWCLVEKRVDYADLDNGKMADFVVFKNGRNG